MDTGGALLARRADGPGATPGLDAQRVRSAAPTEEWVREIVDGILDAIVWEADAATVQFLFVSKSAERILGFPVEQWLREPSFWVDHIHPDDRERSVSYCQVETLAGRDHEFEYRMLAADGRTVWLRDQAYLVRDADGKVVRLRGFMVDITHAKADEAALRQALRERDAALEQLRGMTQTLEQRVRQRTAALEASNRELEAFSYSVSHDLRAPIRHIGAYAELVLRASADQLGETSVRHLRSIREAAATMGRLVDGLLGFARMGRTDLAFAPVDLAQVTRAALEELRPELAGRAVDLEVGPLPHVRGDAVTLRMVMGNLLSNALKYSRPRERAVVRVGTHREADGRATVFVRDNGVGFDMRHASKLFGVFERLHTSPEFEGTGIGLANVRRIVERHGGRVWAEATPEAGATFYVELAAAAPGRPPA